MKLDAIFFGAHPDDTELSCGGTIYKLTKSGKKTAIIDLTRGELGTKGNAKLRQKEAAKAGNVLKLTLRANLKIADGRIENNENNRQLIIKFLRKYQPEIIFLPYFHDRHPDHINASHLIKDAAFYSGLDKIKTTFEGKKQKCFRPKKLYYYMQTYTFEPTFIVDISNEFKKKMESVKCYSSQFYNPSSKEPSTFISDKNFLKFIEAKAKLYGFLAGCSYGEPFFTPDKMKAEIENLF